MALDYYKNDTEQLLQVIKDCDALGIAPNESIKLILATAKRHRDWKPKHMDVDVAIPVVPEVPKDDEKDPVIF